MVRSSLLLLFGFAAFYACCTVIVEGTEFNDNEEEWTDNNDEDETNKGVQMLLQSSKSVQEQDTENEDTEEGDEGNVESEEEEGDDETDDSEEENTENNDEEEAETNGQCAAKCKSGTKVCAINAAGQHKTFDSDCQRLKQNCKSSYQFCFLRNGACEEKPTKNNCDKLCADTNYDPICAYDSKNKKAQVFWNSCKLQIYNCLNKNSNFKKQKGFKKCNGWKENKKCKVTGKKGCSCEEKWICAQNGAKQCLSFINKCFLDQFNCMQKDKNPDNKNVLFKKISDGKCPSNCGKPTQECTDYRKCKCIEICTKEYKPLCGCRKNPKNPKLVECKTFSNLCEFKKANCKNPLNRYTCTAQCACQGTC